jgi:hypothetical protein
MAPSSRVRAALVSFIAGEDMLNPSCDFLADEQNRAEAYFDTPGEQIKNFALVRN